jgi:hypothetical protein
MIHDTDILIKLHKEAMVFLENEREDDEEEAVKKYFETFNILFDLVKRYGVKFPCHIIDKITVQQFLILKKCGVNVNSIQKLILEEDDSETSESEILQDSDSEVKINPFVSKAENPFIRGLVPIPTLPALVIRIFSFDPFVLNCKSYPNQLFCIITFPEASSLINLAISEPDL